MEFCKAFNAATDSLEKYAYSSRNYSISRQVFCFTTKNAPVSYFLKKAAGLGKGGQTPGREVAGKVTVAQVEEIGRTKDEGS